jgi:hypothetical protein
MLEFIAASKRGICPSGRATSPAGNDDADA